MSAHLSAKDVYQARSESLVCSITWLLAKERRHAVLVAACHWLSELVSSLSNRSIRSVPAVPAGVATWNCDCALTRCTGTG